jgi:hypothetical protein
MAVGAFHPPVWAVVLACVTLLAITGALKRVGKAFSRPSSEVTIPPALTDDSVIPGAPEAQPADEEERAFRNGCRAVVDGKDEEALSCFQRAVGLTDGAFLAALMAIRLDRPQLAVEYLSGIPDRETELNRHVGKYYSWAAVTFPLIEGVPIEVVPDLRGALLLLFHAQIRGRLWDEARATLERLHRIARHDPPVKLAYVRWLMRSKFEDPMVLRKIRLLTAKTPDAGEIEACLLLCRAGVLLKLGKPGKALAVLTALQGRRAERSTAFKAAVDQARIAALMVPGKIASKRTPSHSHDPVGHNEGPTPSMILISSSVRSQTSYTSPSIWRSMASICRCKPVLS